MNLDQCNCVNNTQGSIWKFAQLEDRTLKFKLCNFCEAQIMQGNENFDTLSDHIYKKIHFIEEMVEFYKRFIQQYEAQLKTIQQEINKIVLSFYAQIENLENILDEQRKYAANLLKNAQPKNSGISFLKLEFEILPDELQKLKSQLQKYEKKLQCIQELQKKKFQKQLGVEDIILYDKIFERNFSKNYKIDAVMEQKSNIIQAQLFEGLELLAFSCQDKCLYIWNYYSNKMIDIYENQSVIYSIRFAAFRSCHLYIGDENGFIKIFILERDGKFKLRQLFQFKEHQKRIQYLVDNCPNQIISSSLDNKISINEIFTGKLIRKIEFKTYVQSNFDYEYAVNLLVSPDGQSLKIWDADNFDNYLTYENAFDSDQEIQVQIANFGHFVLASCKREVKIFQLSFAEKIFNLVNILETNYKIKSFYCPAINNQIVLVMDGLIQIAEIDIGIFNVLERIPFSAVEYNPIKQSLRLDYLIIVHNKRYLSVIKKLLK
ncbi:hypothetical protein pb186bvf_006768 [Paramecium bursaria]